MFDFVSVIKHQPTSCTNRAKCGAFYGTNIENCGREKIWQNDVGKLI